MKRFLTKLVGVTPKRLRVDFVDHMILVRASNMFPRAETTMFARGADHALYEHYFEELFRITGDQLKVELSKNLHCSIKQIHHVLDTKEKELDIMIHLGR
jgi:uncharacterized protein YbcI